jgi:hypothetical protein
VIGATISVISATAFSKNANIVVYFLVLSFTITKIRRIFIPNETVFETNTIDLLEAIASEKINGEATVEHFFVLRELWI